MSDIKYPMRKGIGLVYVMLRGDGLRKIGYTSSEVEIRRADLQLQWRLKFTIERTWPMGDEAALAVEQEAIRRLAPFRPRRLMGSVEVVDASLAVVVEVVRKVMLGFEVRANSGERILLPAYWKFGLRAHRGLAEGAPRARLDFKVERAVMQHASWLLGGGDPEAAAFIHARTVAYERNRRRREKRLAAENGAV